MAGSTFSIALPRIYSRDYVDLAISATRHQWTGIFKAAEDALDTGSLLDDQNVREKSNMGLSQLLHHTKN